MKRHFVSVAFGVLGVLVALGVWHAYVDHQNFHAMLDVMIQAQRSAAPAK